MHEESSQEIEDAKRTIRLLLNLGRDASAAEGERKNAVAAAHRAMQRYQLAEADLASAAARSRMDLQRVDAIHKRLAEWEESLATFVCELIGSIDWYVGNGEKQGVV